MAEKKGLNVRSTKDKSYNESAKSLYNGDRRLGFVNKYQSGDDPRRTTYNVGIDNTGSPYRGAMDREINTPLGTIGYGYDGDTSYANITPPALNSYDYSYPNGSYQSKFINNIAGMYPGVYSHPHNGVEHYGAEIEGFPAIGNGWNTYNTPFGTVNAGLSDDQVLGAEITPNAYVQTLINLLKR